MRRGRLSKVISGVLLAAGVGGSVAICSADEPAGAARRAGPASSGLYVKVQLKAR